MPREPVAPTPEQIVADAVANSRLSGYEVPEDVQAIMLRIARGEMSADQVEAWEQGAEQRSHRSRPKSKKHQVNITELSWAERGGGRYLLSVTTPEGMEQDRADEIARVIHDSGFSSQGEGPLAFPPTIRMPRPSCGPPWERSGWRS